MELGLCISRRFKRANGLDCGRGRGGYLELKIDRDVSFLVALRSSSEVKDGWHSGSRFKCD